MQDYFFGYNDKKNWHTNLDGFLQQTNRFKAMRPIHIKPPTALFNKYIVHTYKKNMYYC